MAPNPRVFISYARKDGEEKAKELFERIEAEGIPCSFDRVLLKGGQNWWQQIKDELNKVEFFVLVMTPGAIESEWTRKEWVYARQQGVCVFPVISAENLDFDSLPRWMSKSHFYDLDHQWDKFINDLNTRCVQPRVPFMVEDFPDIFIERPVEFEQLVKSLLDENRENPKAITTTTALKGAGGFGKTTLAIALCHDDEIQQAFHDGILWVTLGENPGDLVGMVSDLIIRLTGENPGYTSLEAASDHLADLLADREILMVIDDVWDSAHLRPFRRGGDRCTRLITTRDSATLPAGTIRIDLDEMKPQEAVDLLMSGLSECDENEFYNLTTRLGEWPLLLKLANARLRERVNIGGEKLDATLTYVNKTLDKRGITAFDIQDSDERNNAVDVTLGLSLELLKGEEAVRFLELAIFPEDADIPLNTLVSFWGQTAGLDELDTEDLCQRFYRLSLLQQYNLATRRIKLHDVVRSYLINKAGREITELHKTLLASYDLQRWANLSENEPYLWDYLAYHQVEAEQQENLSEMVKDFQYLAKKTWLRKSYAVEKDLQKAVKASPKDESLEMLYRNYRNAGHLLNQCQNLNDVSLNLYGRLSYMDKIEQDMKEKAKSILLPHLFYYRQPPDLPHPALIRALSGHTSSVKAVVISRDGGTIISGSDDNTVRVWDAETGELRHNLEGHLGSVNAVAISRDGSTIVSGSDDNTVRVWDAESGELRHNLEGHTLGPVSAVAISRDGGTIISSAVESTVRVWDAKSGELRYNLEGLTNWVSTLAISRDRSTIVLGGENTVRVRDAKSGELWHNLEGHTEPVFAVAISRDGGTIVSGSGDNTVRVWDAESGELRHSLEGHLWSVNAVAISRDGGTIVSGSNDNTVRVWDAESGELRHNLEGHFGSVNAVAISRDGGTIVSGSNDNTVRVWDAESGGLWHNPKGHLGSVNEVAISRDGGTIVSSSDDNTVRVWDAESGELRHNLEGHIHGVSAVAISRDGGTIISGSGDNTVRVWDAKSGELRHNLEGRTSWVSTLAISGDGSTIVLGDENTVIVWDAESGELRHNLEGHTNWVSALAISRDGGMIISSTYDNRVRVWDAESGELRHNLDGHTLGPEFVLAFSRDGGTIVSGSGDNTVRVWDAESGELRHNLEGHLGSVNAVAISRDGGTIVSGSGDNTVRVWDAESGEYYCGIYTEGSISDCQWHPDGKRIIVGGAGGVYFLKFVK
jgi:WD40 repeat protein